MLTYQVQEENSVREYTGFATYNPRKDIPFRSNVHTYLVCAYPNGEQDWWVVQICDKINGLKELVKYYRDSYGWESIPYRFFVISPTNQG